MYQKPTCQILIGHNWTYMAKITERRRAIIRPHLDKSSFEVLNIVNAAKIRPNPYVLRTIEKDILFLKENKTETNPQLSKFISQGLNIGQILVTLGLLKDDNLLKLSESVFEKVANNKNLSIFIAAITYLLKKYDLVNWIKKNQTVLITMAPLLAPILGVGAVGILLFIFAPKIGSKVDDLFILVKDISHQILEVPSMLDEALEKSTGVGFTSDEECGILSYFEWLGQNKKYLIPPLTVSAIPTYQKYRDELQAICNQPKFEDSKEGESYQARKKQCEDQGGIFVDGQCFK